MRKKQYFEIVDAGFRSKKEICEAAYNAVTSSVMIRDAIVEALQARRSKDVYLLIDDEDNYDYSIDNVDDNYDYQGAVVKLITVTDEMREYHINQILEEEMEIAIAGIEDATVADLVEERKDELLKVYRDCFNLACEASVEVEVRDDESVRFALVEGNIIKLYDDTTKVYELTKMHDLYRIESLEEEARFEINMILMSILEE